MHSHRTRSLARTAAAGLLAASAFGLAACGNDTAGAEEGTTVGDIQEDDAAAAAGPYDGPYDADFYDDIESYDGQQVTVSADVNEVISPTAFTIAGTDDTTVESLLVVGAAKDNALKPELTVKVTGTVHKAFDLPTVERELGVDLDDALFESYDAEPYITATAVDTSVASDE